MVYRCPAYSTAARYKRFQKSNNLRCAQGSLKIIQGSRLHCLQRAAPVIRSCQYQHPQFHIDFHGLDEHLLPFEPITPLVQNDQVKRLARKALPALRVGRTGSHLASQFLKNGSVV